ncbi:MAG: hypothetical protein JOZ27_02165 [Caulobacteraceae bacterium]|nr:hypothetical protein [Caulobacteraceae bacterium]
MQVSTPNRNALIGIFVALVLMLGLSFFIAHAIAFGRWPDGVAAERIQQLGWGLLLSIFTCLVLATAVAGSKMGHVTAKVGEASVDVSGAPAVTASATVTTGETA